MTQHDAQQARPAGPVTVSRPGDMAWSGIQTFAKVPLCLTPADLRAAGADVAIGGAPWEGTATSSPLMKSGSFQCWLW